MIKDKVILLSHENCGPCIPIKKALEGKIPVYDIGKSDEAFDLFVKSGKIRHVPVVLERNGNDWEECNLQMVDGKVIVDCKTKHLEAER